MRTFRTVILLASALAIGISACSITPLPEPLPATTSTASAAQSSLPTDLELHVNGLGPFRFGDDGDAVIEGITTIAGGWDADSYDSDALPKPACPGGPSHTVSWGSLVLVFVEQDSSDVFTGWAYGFDPLTGNTDDNRSLDLTTPEGIGLGSTRNDLDDVFGPAVSVTEDTDLDIAVFVVDGAGPTFLTGKLDSSDPFATIDFLETSPSC